MSVVTFSASTLLNYSPRKSRLVINPLRGKILSQAMIDLTNMNKGKTKKFYNLLKCAANNLNLSEADYDKYYISAILVEEAQRLYRMMPRARGVSNKIRRRYSRIKVALLPKGGFNE